MAAFLAELLEFVAWVDHRVAALTISVRHPFLTKAMTSVTGLGSATAALVFLGGCHLAGWTDEFRSAAVAFAVVGVAVGTMMWTVQRPFPPSPVCMTAGGDTVATSFPSGHAAAVTVYALTARRSAVLPFAPVALLAAAIAVSRIYLGTHYVSDTLVGVLVGVAAFALALALADRVDLDAVAAYFRP